MSRTQRLGVCSFRLVALLGFGFSLGSPVVSLAAEDEQPLQVFSCVTTPKATRSIVVKQFASQVDFQFYENDGVSDVQVHYGPVSDRELAELPKARELIGKVGRRLQVTMPIASCKMNGLIFRCENSDPQSQLVNGHQVRLISVFSELILSSSVHGFFKTTNIIMSIDVDGERFFMPISYQDNECGIFNPQDENPEAERLNNKADINSI